MVLNMSRPWKHPKTGIYYYRKVVPERLRAIVGKREIKQSLKTKDYSEAKLRFAEAAAVYERYLTACANPPQTLLNKQIVALSGVLYHRLVKQMAEEPGSTEIWKLLGLRDAKANKTPDELEQWYGSSVDDLLLEKGLHIGQASRERLLLAVSAGLRQAFGQLRRNAEGDYRPDPDADRFPEWQPQNENDTKQTPVGVSLEDILTRWWKEAKAAGFAKKTYEAYSGVVKRFVKHLGHSDPRRVTPQDVVAYKDARLGEVNPRTGKNISPKTIKDTDLAGLKTLFGWARTNQVIDINPAEGITLKVGKKQKLRERGFTDQEARCILEASEKLIRGREGLKTYLSLDTIALCVHRSPCWRNSSA